MNHRNVDEIRSVMESKDYSFFEKGIYNLNIIGERTMNEETNEFDDTLHVVYREKEGGELISRTFQITTDPGKYWLKHPMNKDGCAIVVPNQYRGLWAIGKHQGKYEALRQVGMIKVYRDDDRDNELDFDPTTIKEGRYGINCHRSNPYTESYYVDKWSAGCQVFKKIKEYNEFMELCRKSRSLYGNSFTYTLLTSDDFGVAEAA